MCLEALCRRPLLPLLSLLCLPAMAWGAEPGAMTPEVAPETDADASTAGGPLLDDGAASAQAVSLEDLGRWDVPAGWTLAEGVGVRTGGDHDPETGEGRVTEGISKVFLHGSGEVVTAITLGKSQALSLKKVGAHLAGPFTDRKLEHHGALAWWHYISPDGDVYATGAGGKSAFVLLPPAAGIPPEDVARLLQGLDLQRDNIRVDETWLTFDLPADVAYVHRDAAPFSWNRGEGIIAVDVTFDKAPESELVTNEKYAQYQDVVPGWAIVAAPVSLQLKGMEAFNDSMAQMNGAPPPDTLKALVAAPGSFPPNNAIALVRRDGILRVELRAEGGDAALLLHNDLIPMAQTLEMKAHYDWWPDSRRMRHKMSRDFAEEMLVDALPVLIETAALTQAAIRGEGLGTVTGTGLTVAQSIPLVGFQLFELGRARTPTEDTTATTLGYIPSAEYQIQGYFGDPDSTLSTTVQGVGAGIAQNARFFRQRGQLAVNWAVYWPQEGETVLDVDTLSAGTYKPFVAKLKGGYAIDPTTWLLPHRFGAFGEWHAGLGIGTTLEYSMAEYTTNAGESDVLFLWNTGFNPTASFATRLFWGAVHLYGQGYITPSQLGLVNIFTDSGSKLQIEAMADNGEFTDLGSLFQEVGASAFLTYAMGTGRFDGGRGFSASMVVGAPFGIRGNIHPRFTPGMSKGQGPMPPLGAKLTRFTALSTLGLGVTVFYDEASWVPFSSQWTPDGPQDPVKTVNKGILIGLGSAATNLPSFSSGPR